MDRIKYSAVLPGEEFRRRQLSVPAEAAKTLFDIDFSYGRDRELCFFKLQNVFRGTEGVTQILQESREILKKGKQDGAPWRYEATIQRNLNKTLREQELEEEKAKAKTLEKEHAKLLKQEKDFEEGDKGGREEVIKGIKANITENRRLHAESKLEFTRIAQELAVFKADPLNQRFSREEERQAKASLAEKEEGNDKENENEAEWKGFLESLLVVLVKAPNAKVARTKLDGLAVQVIESCPRELKSQLDFALELDKACQFAKWQTNILYKDPDRLAELTVSLEQKELATFKASLKTVEEAKWNFLDADEEGAFKKLLTRLRATTVVNPTVPVLPVKVAKRAGKGKDKEEDDMDEEEEESTAPSPKKKPTAKTVAPVTEEKGEDQSALIAAITGVFTKFSDMMPPRAPAENSQGPQQENKAGWVSSPFQGGRGGGRGGRGGGRGGRGGGQAGRINSNRQCSFRPCVRPGCLKEHDVGQHTPDEAAFLRNATFSAKVRCLAFHDGNCERGTACKYTHGKSTLSAARCAQVGKGMCENFYKGAGCVNAHKV